MVVVHPDAEFLDDIAGKLKEVCDNNLNSCKELFVLYMLLLYETLNFSKFVGYHKRVLPSFFLLDSLCAFYIDCVGDA